MSMTGHHINDLAYVLQSVFEKTLLQIVFNSYSASYYSNSPITFLFKAMLPEPRMSE
jgi:hypothetical protein